MAIRITQPHRLPIPEVVKRLNSVTASVEKDYGVKAKWQPDGRTAKLTGKATGAFVVHPDRVEATLEVGFLARLFEATIEREVKRRLKEGLA